MLVYLVLAFIVGLFAFFENGNRTKQTERLFMIAMLVFLIVVGFRYRHGDYATYQMGYYEDIDIGGDFGYFQLQKMFHKLGLSFQIFVFIITLFSVFCIRQTLKISLWPTFGLMVMLGKIFTMYAMSGIRQYLAMVVCWCAVSILFTSKNKNKMMIFLGMVLLAYTLHGSAIVFLPVVFFVNREFKYVTAFVIVIISIVVGQFVMSIFGAAANMSDLIDIRFGNYVRDVSERSMNISNYIENFVFLILALIARKTAVKKIPYYDFFLYMFLIYCGFLIAGSDIGVVKRLRDYYALSYAFIIPGMFYLFKQKKIMQFVLIAYFILLMFRSLLVYDSSFPENHYDKMIPYHSILQMD